MAAFQRAPSEDLAEMLAVPRDEARRLIDDANGDPDEAAARWLREAEADTASRSASLLVAESAGVSRQAAREAINASQGSQLLLLELLARKAASNAAAFECTICCGAVAPGDGVRLLDCGHEFCGACLAHMVDAQLADNRTEVSCPEPGCGRPITQREQRSILGESRYNLVERRALEKAVASDRTLHLCPTPDCPYVIAWAGPQDGPPKINCPTCGKVRCLVCGAEPFHEALTCDQHRERRARVAGPPDAAELATQEYLKRSKIRACQQCGQGVVKAEGCNKMMCRCGYKFCYNCGVANATCSCTPANHYFWDNVDNALGPQS